MSLNASSFANLAVKYYLEEMKKAFPSAVIGREVTEKALPSGETTYVVTDQIGALDIDPEKIRPLMLAIGRAVVATMQQQAEVIGSLGERWRIE